MVPKVLASAPEEWREKSVHRGVFHTPELSGGQRRPEAGALHFPVFQGWEAEDTVREAKKGQKRAECCPQVKWRSSKKTDPWMWHLRSQ